MLSFLVPVVSLLLEESDRGRLSVMMQTAKEGARHPDLSKFLVIGALLFIIGVAGVLTRRNILVIFISI